MTNYTSPEYEPSGAIAYFDGVNRFGHTENFYDAIDGNRSDLDYNLGLLLIPGLVLSITLVWFIILGVSACMRCRSCLLIPKGHGAITRTFFLVSACLILISTISFFVYGGGPFTDAFDNVERSTVDIFELSDEAINRVAEIRVSIGKFTETSQKLQINIDGGICEDLPQEVQNSLKDISAIIDTSEYTDVLDQLEVIENSLMESFTDGLQSQIDDVLEFIETNITVAKYIVFPWIFTAFLLGCGAVISWCSIKSKIYYLFLSCVIMPLFTLLALISSVIVSLLGILLIIFSDLCTGGETQSPEGSIAIILENTQLNGIARDVIDYYIVDGCRATNPFGGLIATINAFEDISKEVNEAVDSVRGIFEVTCSDSTELDALLTETNVHLLDLNNAVLGAINLTECERMNSIYVTAVHEGFCTNTPDALWWLFGCFMAVWVGGLFMLISRAACQPSCREDKKNKNDMTSNDDSDSIYVIESALAACQPSCREDKKNKNDIKSNDDSDSIYVMESAPTPSMNPSAVCY